MCGCLEGGLRTMARRWGRRWIGCWMRGGRGRWSLRRGLPRGGRASRWGMGNGRGDTCAGCESAAGDDCIVHLHTTIYILSTSPHTLSTHTSTQRPTPSYSHDPHSEQGPPKQPSPASVSFSDAPSSEPPPATQQHPLSSN